MARQRCKVSASVHFGTGTPGAATGPKGSIYLRLDGGTDTTLYIREAAGAVVNATANLDGITIANNDTVTIGSQVYTFKTTLSTGPAIPYEVRVGASDSVSIDYLVAAINAAAGSGTDYSSGTLINPLVSAAAGAGDTMDITAKADGEAGNGIALASGLTAGVWNKLITTGGTYDNGTGWVAK